MFDRVISCYRVGRSIQDIFRLVVNLHSIAVLDRLQRNQAIVFGQNYVTSTFTVLNSPFLF